MQPLQLTLTAFGPYPGTETVDFEALNELGLFVVSGPNGSGKTSIFDALFYALYGGLPGRRSTYGRLRSDHAHPSVECSVTLDFQSRGELWRVVRAPRQTRAKKRGTGTTEVGARAELHRLLADGTTEPISSRLSEIDERCRALVGLSARQFERVALLPQGEFSRVLRESPTDRRALLRTLFSSEVFDQATALLVEQSQSAVASHQAERDHLANDLRRLARDLDRLAGNDGVAIDETPADDVAADAGRGLRQRLDRYIATELTPLRERVARLATEMQRLDADLTNASTVAAAVTRRDELTANLDQLLGEQSAHDERERRLNEARAAVPVHEAASALASAETRTRGAAERFEATLTTAQRALDEYQQAAPVPADVGRALNLSALGGPASVTPGLAAARATLDTLIDRHSSNANHQRALETGTQQLAAATEQRRRRVTRIAALNDDHRTLVARQTRIADQLAALPSSREVDARRDEASSAQQLLTAHLRSDEVRGLLADTSAQRAAVATRMAELQQHHDRALDATAAAVDLAAKEQRETDALAALHQRRRDLESLDAVRNELPRLREARDLATRRSDELLDRFVLGSAARLRDQLDDDQPCPVCGSCDHPQPAAPLDDGAIVDTDDIDRAQTAATAAQQAVATAEETIRRLTDHDPALATLDPVELQAQTDQATSAALSARREVETNHALARSLPAAAADIEAARHQIAQFDVEAQRLESELDHLQSQLGPDADTTIGDVRAAADAAAATFADARERAAQAPQLQSDREAVERELDTVSLLQLEADQNLAGVEDELDRLKTEIASVRRHLADAADVDHDRAAQHARAVRDLISDLETTRGVVAEATAAERSAQLLVTERLRQSAFADVDAAQRSHLESQQLRALDHEVRAWATQFDQLQGQLREVADAPSHAPDVAALAAAAATAAERHREANHQLIENTAAIRQLMAELERAEATQIELDEADESSRDLQRVSALVRGDNDRNTSLENWVLAAHLREVVELANVRLARSTGGRFQLLVLDDGENRRGTWGLEIAVEDTVTGTHRPTAGLSGGELFQASLALALGLADVVMANAAGVHIDALFIDEGFGSLDHASVDRVIDLLDDLRGQGATIGLITHVPALLQALPCGVHVEQITGGGSTIHQQMLAA